MKSKFDVIAVGDTQYDAFLELEEETKLFKDELGKKYLGVAFAEKISVKTYTPVLAVGNAANVAIGCSRLGLQSALYTVLGNDYVGKEEMKLFEKEGVKKDYIVWDKTRGSNFSAVLNYKAERTILVFHEPREYSLPKLASAKWLYYTSLARGHEKLHIQIPEYVRQCGAKLAFNPGSHQLEEGINALGPILEVVEVLFVNKEEAEVLVGKDESVHSLLLKLRALGPKIAVITLGPAGVWVSDSSGVWFCDIFPAPLVERTGAGDSFATGFITALCKGNDVPEAIRWGMINSASVIQYIGAREGLLKKQEMERILKDNQQFMPQKK